MVDAAPFNPNEWPGLQSLLEATRRDIDSRFAEINERITGVGRYDERAWARTKEFTDSRFDELDRKLQALAIAGGRLSETQHDAIFEKIRDLKESIKQSFEASQSALEKATTATEKRFESVNEFRKNLTDLSGTFMPRNETVALAQRNSERIDELRDRINRSEGRGAGLNQGWQFLIAAVGFLAVIFALYQALKTGG